MSPGAAADPDPGAPAILYVDDEPKTLKYFARAFGGEFRVLTAASAAEAEQVLAGDGAGDGVGVLVTDQRMPLETGVQLLVKVKERYPQVIRLLTTAYTDLAAAMLAVNRGEIHRFILKPWDLTALREDLRSAMQLHRRRRAELDLLMARRETMTGLASHVAHELATPLATIASAAAGIERYLPPLVAAYRHAPRPHTGAIPEPVLAALATSVKTIEDAANRSRIFLSLMLMNAGSGRAPGESASPVSIRAVIDEAFAGFPFASGDRDLIRITGSDFLVLGSPTLLIHVIYNLIKNALDAIHSAGHGDLCLHLAPGASWNLLSVVDTGCGVPPEAVPRVFDEFFSLKRVGCGTGMGLPYCRRVLSALGGTIDCTSRLGEYTQLDLRFPPVPEHLRDEGRVPEEQQ